MDCTRCLGFMVIDACLNMEGDRNKSWSGGVSTAEKSLTLALWRIVPHNTTRHL